MADADARQKIPHGEHLTFTDLMMGQFKPAADRDDTTGRVVYPREEYLTERARVRREEYDAEQRKKRMQGEGS